MIDNIEKKRKPRRTNRSIEKSVMNAASSLIEEVGFANVTLTGITQRAGIEPSVFYRRFANLNELFDLHARNYDFWVAHLNEKIPGGMTAQEGYNWLLKHLTESLYTNKGMQQLLIWELSENNLVTQRTSEFREKAIEPFVKILEDVFHDSHLDSNTIAALLIGGIYYNILHKDKSLACDVDFSTENGKKRMKDSLEQLISLLFQELDLQKEKINIANKLRKHGVSEEIIKNCLH